MFRRDNPHVHAQDWVGKMGEVERGRRSGFREMPKARAWIHIEGVVWLNLSHFVFYRLQSGLRRHAGFFLQRTFADYKEKFAEFDKKYVE